MERQSSLIPKAVAVLGLLAVLLAGYGVVYWYRLPTVATAWKTRGVFEFPTPAETAFFSPAMAIHGLIHPASMIQRGMPNEPYTFIIVEP